VAQGSSSTARSSDDTLGGAHTLCALATASVKFSSWSGTAWGVGGWGGGGKEGSCATGEGSTRKLGHCLWHCWLALSPRGWDGVSQELP
jgi:hypothetical protein